MRKLSESVWGSIRKKSLGQEVRIENDVDRLSYKDFLGYLEGTYIPTDEYVITTTPSISNPALMLIQVPIWTDMGDGVHSITINYQTKTGLYHSYDKDQPSCVAISSLIFHEFPELENALNEYDIDKTQKKSVYVIDTKEGPLKNSDCVNILDIVLGIIYEPLVKKEQV